MNNFIEDLDPYVALNIGDLRNRGEKIIDVMKGIGQNMVNQSPRLIRKVIQNEMNKKLPFVVFVMELVPGSRSNEMRGMIKYENPEFNKDSIINITITIELK